MSEQLTIAVSKGRIFREALPLLARLDIVPSDDPDETRKLILNTNQGQIRLIIIRATDVPAYVEYGAADIGIVGKDILMEYNGINIYEPLDLKIAKCRMVLAGFKDRETCNLRPRIATKYVNSTKKFFTNKGVQVEIIKLYGSMEIAPVLGLSDQIVDLVDTGNTLRANGLVPLEVIYEISSRLIVNKASMKIKHRTIKDLISRLAGILENQTC